MLCLMFFIIMIVLLIMMLIVNIRLNRFSVLIEKLSMYSVVNVFMIDIGIVINGMIEVC